jgi:hypothetical protein
MSGDFPTLHVPQEIFTLFYAITWGTAANSQPRWKAFAWGAFFQYPETRRRALLSFVILNGSPLIYFILILWCLNSGKWTNASLWTILLSILPAFAPFGFYRIWTGCVGLWRERFYGVSKDWKKNDPLPPEWQAIGIDLCPNIDLNRDFACGNLLWGLIYVIVGVVVALFLRCL